MCCVLLVCACIRWRFLEGTTALRACIYKFNVTSLRCRLAVLFGGTKLYPQAKLTSNKDTTCLLTRPRCQMNACAGLSMHVRNFDDPNFPKGCFLCKDCHSNVIFNNHPEGSADPMSAPVCVGIPKTCSGLSCVWDPEDTTREIPKTSDTTHTTTTETTAPPQTDASTTPVAFGPHTTTTETTAPPQTDASTTPVAFGPHSTNSTNSTPSPDATASSALVNKGIHLCQPNNKCSACQGDCDTDLDCLRGFKCYQGEDSRGAVPGCRGAEHGVFWNTCILNLGNPECTHMRIPAPQNTTPNTGIRGNPKYSTPPPPEINCAQPASDAYIHVCMLCCSSGYENKGSFYCEGSRSEILPAGSFGTLQSCKDACSRKGDACNTLNYYPKHGKCYSCPATDWSSSSSSKAVMFKKVTPRTFISFHF